MIWQVSRSGGFCLPLVRFKSVIEWAEVSAHFYFLVQLQHQAGSSSYNESITIDLFMQV